MSSEILLTGATGFVGRALYPQLVQAGWKVRCGTRSPQAAREREPERQWVYLDVDRPESLEPALSGCQAAIYLIHSMGSGTANDFEQQEKSAATAFAEIAEACALQRIVYLGGTHPVGEPSKHLRSRLQTGEILRAGKVPTFELRAAMIIGAESESWKICRDLAVRLPLMLLPKWLESCSSPIATQDVALALRSALELPLEKAGWYDLPGPEVLSAREILERVGQARGLAPWTFRVPFLTPRLSSYWLRFVTRANTEIASALVEGLRSDLIPNQPGFWKLLPGHEPLPLREAIENALLYDTQLPLRTQLLERALQWLTPSIRKTPD